MKYMIHACPPRMWYVNGYLLPSMLAQGIPRDDITVWNDAKGLGNLQSFLQSMKLCSILKEPGVWHLQDDVVLSASFAKRTDALAKARDEPVICGFGCDFGDGVIGFTGRSPVSALWYSFPCIYISNVLAGEFADWFEREAKTGERYRDNLASGKMDDWFFREFLTSRHHGEFVYHETPALVDHVDYLIGGTVVNPRRLRKYNPAKYWAEPEIIEDLRARLNVYKRTGRII